MWRAPRGAISARLAPENRRLFVVSGIIAALVAALVVFFARGLLSAKAPTIMTPRPDATTLSRGAPVPLSFDLSRLGGGKNLDLKSLTEGHPSVVNVFSSDCAACAEELDAFANVAKTYALKVSFVGLDTNEPNPRSAINLLRRAGGGYPVALDTPELTVATALGVANLPTTLFVGANGHLENAVLGAMSRPRLEGAVKSLLMSSAKHH